MFPFATSRQLPTLAALTALLLLSACGGGGNEATHDASHVHDDDAPALADGPATPSDAPLVAGEPPPPAQWDSNLLALVESSQVSALASTESITLAAAYTPMITGTINNTAYWPVWWGTGKPLNGVNCLKSGAWHRHMIISIYKNGKRLGFPDGVGRVHAGCYHAYEMHNHDVTGIIHMEADVPRAFKLGQWFSLWQQPLSTTNTAGLAGPVRFYIIENYRITPYYGDPKLIDMLPHREILIVTGTQMYTVPKYVWPSGV